MTVLQTSIPGGYAMSWRKEFQSEVWLMPPIYHRVWYWIRTNVQYETFLFPTRERYGIWVLPGQRITSLQQIAEGVKWLEWGKEKIPNKRTIKAVLDWLVSREMVTAESNAKGTLINVTNWHTYNKQSMEKVTAVSHAKYTRSAHKEERIEVIKELKPIASNKSSQQKAPISFDFTTGKFSGVNGHREVWVVAYPAVDIDAEFSKAAAWLIANPKNRKSNYARFLNSWLSRSQDKVPRQTITSPAVETTSAALTPEQIRETMERRYAAE